VRFSDTEGDHIAEILCRRPKEVNRNKIKENERNSNIERKAVRGVKLDMVCSFTDFSSTAFTECMP